MHTYIYIYEVVKKAHTEPAALQRVQACGKRTSHTPFTHKNETNTYVKKR